MLQEGNAEDSERLKCLGFSVASDVLGVSGMPADYSTGGGQ